MNKNQIVIFIDEEIKKLQEAAKEIPLQIKSLEMTKKYFSTISDIPMIGTRVDWEILIKSAPTDKKEFRAFVRKNYPQISEKALQSAAVRLFSKGLLK